MAAQSQQNEQQIAAAHKPSERSNIFAALITTAIWTAVGAVMGRMIGSIGDRLPTGAGGFVGTWIGGITAGTIAFGTSLKIIGKDKEKYKDLQFADQTRMVDGWLSQQQVPAAMVNAPYNAVSDAHAQGVLHAQGPEQAR